MFNVIPQTSNITPQVPYVDTIHTHWVYPYNVNLSTSSHIRRPRNKQPNYRTKQSRT